MTADRTSSGRPVWRIALDLALIAAFLVTAHAAGGWVMGEITPYLTPSTEPALHRAIMTAITVYVLLMMLPFVPGIEIGLGLMAMFGPRIAPLVYGGTVLALTLAFLAGRLLPQRTIVETFETLRLRRAAGLLRQLEPLDSAARLQFLLQNASSRIVRHLLRYRLLALAAALNMPGNAVIGGGGGICLVMGFSRLFSLPTFVLTVAVAVSPVPLLLLITGS